MGEDMVVVIDRDEGKTEPRLIAVGDILVDGLVEGCGGDVYGESS